MIQSNNACPAYSQTMEAKKIIYMKIHKDTLTLKRAFTL